MPARIWLLAAALALLLAPTASAVVRHASPTGVESVSNCTSSEPPCSLRRAVETVSVAGDEIIVATGLYNISAPMVVKAVNLHGATGQPRPRIVSSAPRVFNVSSEGATVADLRLEAPGSVIGTGGSSVLERLTVLAGAAGSGSAVTLSDGGILRDSLVHTTATNGRAVHGVRETPRLVNVTAIATDAGGVGVVSDPVVGGICVPPYSTKVLVTNSILRGGLYDVSAPDVCNGGFQAVIVAASNVRPSKVNQTPPESRVLDAGGNQEADPLFAAPASLDFHQLAGSPTIDAGVGGANLGTGDVDGEARTMGARPDIGADEYAPPAAPAPPGPTPDTRAPVASLLAMAPDAFRAARRGSRAPQRRRRTGTRISYALDEAASVAFTVQRRVRRRGRTRYVAVPGSLVNDGATGGNRLRFSGRLGAKTLKRGRYRLVAVPTDAAGNVGRAVRASFRIVR